VKSRKPERQPVRPKKKLNRSFALKMRSVLSRSVSKSNVSNRSVSTRSVQKLPAFFSNLFAWHK
jgi:hypothetical protein